MIIMIESLEILKQLVKKTDHRCGVCCLRFLFPIVIKHC